MVDEHTGHHRRHPLPLPESKWLRRGVVIGGAGWAYYPDVDDEAARRIAELPGARHIDELQAALAAKEAADAGQGTDRETE